MNSREPKKKSTVVFLMTFKKLSRESVITCFYAFKSTANEMT